jgi:hypothetical protein
MIGSNPDLWIFFLIVLLPLFALSALLRIVDLPWPWWVLFFAAVVAWCGYSAVKHGDEFWLDAFRNWW